MKERLLLLVMLATNHVFVQNTYGQVENAPKSRAEQLSQGWKNSGIVAVGGNRVSSKDKSIDELNNKLKRIDFYIKTKKDELEKCRANNARLWNEDYKKYLKYKGKREILRDEINQAKGNGRKLTMIVNGIHIEYDVYITPNFTPWDPDSVWFGSILDANGVERITERLPCNHEKKRVYMSEAVWHTINPDGLEKQLTDKIKNATAAQENLRLARQEKNRVRNQK